MNSWQNTHMSVGWPFSFCCDLELTSQMSSGKRGVMNITLTERHKKYVAEKVKEGDYGSADEVVREGLRLLEAEDQRRQYVGWLQSEIEEGFAGPATAWTQECSDRVRRLIADRSGGRR